jgi:uncharacterized protein YndB with AHSA1/START domain
MTRQGRNPTYHLPPRIMNTAHQTLINARPTVRQRVTFTFVPDTGEPVTVTHRNMDDGSVDETSMAREDARKYFDFLTSTGYIFPVF